MKYNLVLTNVLKLLEKTADFLLDNTVKTTFSALYPSVKYLVNHPTYALTIGLFNQVAAATTINPFNSSAQVNYSSVIPQVDLIEFENTITNNTFVVTFGNVSSATLYGNAIFQTPDDGYLISGEMYVMGGKTDANTFLTRCDHNGSLQWAKTLVSSGGNLMRSTTKTNNGESIITGTTGYGEFAFVSKLDEEGNVIWAKIIDAYTNVKESGFAVIVSPNDELIVAGGIFSPGQEDDRLTLLKFNKDGELLWIQTTSDTFRSAKAIHALIQTKDTHFVLLADRSLTKWSNAGDLLWKKSLKGMIENTTYAVSTWAITEATNSDLIITGGAPPFSVYKNAVLVARLDSNGNSLWAKTMGDQGYGHSILATNNDDIVLTGYLKLNNTNHVLFAQLDNAGELIDAKMLNIKNQNTWASAIINTRDMGFAFIGGNSEGRFNVSTLFVKSDANGNIKGCDDMRDIHLTIIPYDLIIYNIHASWGTINLTVTDWSVETEKIFPTQRKICKLTAITETNIPPKTISYHNRPSDALVALISIATVLLLASCGGSCYCIVRKISQRKSKQHRHSDLFPLVPLSSSTQKKTHYGANTLSLTGRDIS